MSRNRFQSILWNLHIADDSQNPRHGCPGHDPLSKLRPFISVVENNFCHVYRPDANISIDEACCPFKGHLRFRCYNPAKANRFHIKLFQVSESSTGYIIGFDVYTGKVTFSSAKESCPMDPPCTRTTMLVLILLEKFKLLDKGHRVYMDNYYTSPELLEELYFREKYACGTVRNNRKGMPITMNSMNVNPLESTSMRNAPCLCLCWKGAKSKTKKKTPSYAYIYHS